MTAKRYLILIPLAVTFVLVQSFFWVPTYDSQAVGNPDRLKQFIRSSIGDAQILNPILNADTASSEIVGHVFDGLLDLDEQLHHRPRLASGWRQYEKAYLDIHPKHFPQGVNSSKEFVEWIKKQMSSHPDWLANIESVEILPAEFEKGNIEIPDNSSNEKVENDKGKKKTRAINFSYHRPARLKFTLRIVDQDFFKPLESLLGKEYFEPEYPNVGSLNDPVAFKHVAAYVQQNFPVIEHNPVIDFDLRQGVRFHDGHEFDSGDVLFTYNAIMNGDNLSPRRSDYEPVKSAQVLGPYSIRFTYKRLFSPAINAWMIGMLPEHLLNSEALLKEAESKGLKGEAAQKFTLRDSDFNRNPIGTGPFEFAEWHSDEMIRLVRNDDYWEGPPEYAEVTTRIIPDPLTQEMEFYAGAVDDYGVQPHQVARLSKDPKYHSLSVVGANYAYIGYNLRNPLFQSAKVRTALGMAIDTDKIIKYVLYGQGERVTGPYAKITDWYDQSVKPVPYDPEGALRLLAEEGWKKNADGFLEKDGKLFEFNLITNNGNPIRKAILSIVQDHWRKIGIKCNTQLFEWAVFLQDFVNALEFDALVLGWSMGTDPDLFQLWHSSQAGPQQLNFVGFKNEEADRLIVSIRQEYDRERQVEMAHRLHQLIAREQPYTFLYVGKSTVLLDKKIVIVERDENGNESYKKVYPVKGGRTRFHFNQWKKLAKVPEFSAG